MSKDILTTELISKALAADVGEVNLLSWKIKDGSKFGDNFFNDTQRIEVTFQQKDKQMKTTYFAKINPQRDNDSFNSYRNHAMKKEIFFYFELLPLLNKELQSINKETLRVPKCLAFSMESEKEVIILEDLCIKEFVTRDRALPFDGDHSDLMIAELVKLHTASILLQKRYAGKTLTEVFPLLVETWNEPNDSYSEGFWKMFAKAMMFNVDLARNLPQFYNLIPWLDDLTRRAMATLKKYLQSTDKFMEICHGDFHRTNVLFKYENNKPTDIMVIDWQTLRLAAVGSELDYYLHSCFEEEQKEEFGPISRSSFYESMYSNLKELVPYTLDELDKHCKSNYFGFLLCFYCIPLSVCVSNTCDLFQVTDKDLLPDPEGSNKAKQILAENQVLRKIMNGLFEYIVKHEIDKNV